ncbi:MAG: hypothetical protein GF344_00380 [Chitinivibrionales bacterium]|nr:hypothetical protein [Chitinivibrionales bacterium]MBD3355583.1 hypothetical protein [Chitinivibrionales bacterium]
MRLLMVSVCVGLIACGISRGEATGAQRPGKTLDLGFDQDSKVLSIGFLQGGSPVGVDFEYGLSYAVGVQAGVGLGGADVGLNFHVASDMYKDLFFSLQAVYWPLFDNLIMPSATFSTRWFMGGEKRVGFTLEFGSAVVLREVSAEIDDKTIEIAENQALPRIGLAVAFKLR